jgi:hypothetical protein
VSVSRKNVKKIAAGVRNDCPATALLYHASGYCSSIEGFRTAHEAIASLIVAKQPRRCTRNADAARDADFANEPIGQGQKQRCVSEERNAVERAIDLECAAKTSGAAAKIGHVGNSATTLHERYAGNWLERAHENAATSSVFFARQVETERRAVDLIDVRVMRSQEQRRVALGFPDKVMACRISRWISFRLNDSPGDNSFGRFANEHVTYERTRQRCRFNR